MCDLQAVYLYNNGYRYSIGSIKKINEKTYTMTCGYKIRKEEFETATYKLNDDEIKIYRGELIKNLSKGIYSLKEFRVDIVWLSKTLQKSPLIQVNTTELQEVVDNLTKVLQEMLPSPFIINGQELTFNKYVPDLVQQVEKEWE